MTFSQEMPHMLVTVVGILGDRLIA